MERDIEIVVGEEGTLSFVWTDALADLAEQGQTFIRRASHVEPTEDGRWAADMRPAVDLLTDAQAERMLGAWRLDGRRYYEAQREGVLFLGPFRTRQEALDAERDWLREHVGL